MQSTNRRGFLRAGAGLGALAATALIPGKIANRVLGKEVTDVITLGEFEGKVDFQQDGSFQVAWDVHPEAQEAIRNGGWETPLSVFDDYAIGAHKIRVTGRVCEKGDVIRFCLERYTVIEKESTSFGDYVWLDRPLTHALRHNTPFTLEKHPIMTADLGTIRKPYTVTGTISGLVAGDRVAVFREKGDGTLEVLENQQMTDAVLGCMQANALDEEKLDKARKLFLRGRAG